MRGGPGSRRLRGTALLALAAAGLAGPGAGFAQELRTRAERTDFVETSRYEDVVAFVDAVVAGSPALRATTFGYTHEGRRLPLVVWAPGLPADTRLERPGALARATADRVRVLVFANIHAGEVDGKEAALILLRDLAAGLHDEWAESLVLLVAPIYNADGNERVTLENRPLQHGPVGGMGQRPNAQGLDLNRDFMKLDAPESRALVALLTSADPHVVIDLHTTNGSVHAYHLTYAPPLPPDADPALDRWARETLLPEVTEAMAGPGRVPAGEGAILERLRRTPWRTWHYGNLAADEGADLPPGWVSFDPRPRFGTNYAGLRNRIGILSESYSYVPFAWRVAASLRFVEEVLDAVAARAGEVRRLVAEADAARIPGTRLALRSALAETGEREVLLGAVDTVPHPWTGDPMLLARDETRPERMATYVAFRATETEVAPAAYLVPPALRAAVDLVAAHGLRSFALAAPRRLAVEEFRIAGSALADEPFQGHRERTVEGEWVESAREVPAGTIVVPLDQPLAKVAFHLLEPRAPDGLVAWDLLPELEDAAAYPVLRTREAVE